MDASVHLLEDARHRTKPGRTNLKELIEQSLIVGGVRSSKPDIDPAIEARHMLSNMSHGQKRHGDVFGTDLFNQQIACLQARDNVLVGQGYPLGLTGRTAGVHHQCDLFLTHRRRPILYQRGRLTEELTAPLLELGDRVNSRTILRLMIPDNQVIEPFELSQQGQHALEVILPLDEDNLGLAVIEYEADLIVEQVGIDPHAHATKLDHGKICQTPARTTLPQDGCGITATEAELAESSRQSIYLLGENAPGSGMPGLTALGSVRLDVSVERHPATKHLGNGRALRSHQLHDLILNRLE